ncbi:MAG TPA: FAD-dependent oxidoreductase [Acidimicrobiales bacterium]|nr:FAD-dependent oxidoreductase [Acidimicrobiales bacterium]
MRDRYQARSPGMGPMIDSALERSWEKSNRYDRVARVTSTRPLTETGTIRMTFEVVDEQPFTLKPGQFVGVQALVGEFGYRKSPYCVLSPPSADRRFELLIRVVPDGPLSQHLASLGEGAEISFRGPTGRSMVPKDDDTNQLCLLATGVGISPFISLVQELSDRGFDRPIRLYWGLRLTDDICLLDELDELVGQAHDFQYQISLSQPPEGWTGLRGRVTESVPPLLETLGDRRFYMVGNGAMNKEMSAALSDLGVSRHDIYEEHYFNLKYEPDPETLRQLRARFVANDLFSPVAHQEAGGWLVRDAQRP